MWARLKDRQPPLPVVIHTFLPEYPTHLTLPIGAAFLEKKGDTDRLKAVVAEVIGKYYPEGVGRVRERNRVKQKGGSWDQTSGWDGSSKGGAATILPAGWLFSPWVPGQACLRERAPPGPR